MRRDLTEVHTSSSEMWAGVGGGGGGTGQGLICGLETAAAVR